MGSRFQENDELRKLWCDAQLAHEKDSERWKSRLETLYAAKPASIERVLQWCRYYGPLPELRSEFFATEAKPLLSGLKFDEQMKLINSLRGLRMDEEIRVVMRGIDTRGLSDEQIVRFVNFAGNYESEDVIMRHINRMKDPLAATKARFDYYESRSHRNKPFMEKALAEIPELRKSPKYAGQQLSWDEGRLLQGLGRYEEAIKAYRSSNRQPDSTWAVAECLERMKQYPEAIKTLREIESVGGNVASRASLEIAKVYRASGDKAREVDQLRIVLRRYPKSGESSEAHRTLENYGVALIGGESEARD
jgi:tetratricopeptide (TPR) repeat protein